MTPKGLLRFRDAASTLDDLLDPTGFRPVIDDPTTSGWREDISRLVLCTGRLYYDLQRHPERARADEVAIARFEQLYPFPTLEVAELLRSYLFLSLLLLELVLAFRIKNRIRNFNSCAFS